MLTKKDKKLHPMGRKSLNPQDVTLDKKITLIGFALQVVEKRLEVTS